MNAQKYLRSRLGITIEQMKVAYLAGKNIIFLVTSEMSFVKEVINYASILPNSPDSNENGFEAKRSTTVTIDNKFDLITSISGLKQAIDKTEFKQQPHLCLCIAGDDSKKIPSEELEKYIMHTKELTSANLKLSAIDKVHLKNLQQSLIIVVTSDQPQLSSIIEPYSEVITVPYMEKKEFEEYVSNLIHTLDGVDLIVDPDGYNIIDDSKYLDGLYNSMRGVNAAQITTTLCKIKHITGRVYFDTKKDEDKPGLNFLLKNIRKETEKIIALSAALTLVTPTNQEPAGLSNLIKWASEHKSQISKPQDYAQYILSAPKGIIVSGIPGSGKSMMAKYIADFFGLSLIKMDLGDVMGGYVGDSEKNMNRALDLIEALSPCVLWVDEMEKAFAGTSGSGGHEVTKRLFGKFLTWMQEKGERDVSCFVFATANDISSMPPEMFRSGRFDEKFYTFMPSANECSQIFESIIFHQCKAYSDQENKNIEAKPLFDTSEINATLMRKLLNSNCCMLDPLSVDSDKVCRKNKFFTGADIDKVIAQAKTLYLNNLKEYPFGRNYHFDSTCFIKCLKIAISEIKTYGETNMREIAICYSQLANNNFTSASDSLILPFDGYNETQYLNAYNNGDKECLLYNLDNQSSHLKQLNEYDKQLFLSVRNAINMMAKELTSKNIR